MFWKTTARPNCVKAFQLNSTCLWWWMSSRWSFKGKVAALPVAPPLPFCSGQHLWFHPRLALIIYKEGERVCFSPCFLRLSTTCWCQYLQDLLWLRDENENVTIWEIATLILLFYLCNAQTHTHSHVVYCVEVKDLGWCDGDKTKPAWRSQILKSRPN